MVILRLVNHRRQPIRRETRRIGTDAGERRRCRLAGRCRAAASARPAAPRSVPRALTRLSQGPLGSTVDAFHMCQLKLCKAKENRRGGKKNLSQAGERTHRCVYSWTPPAERAMGDAASLSLASCIAGRGPPALSARWPHVACEGELQGGPGKRPSASTLWESGLRWLAGGWRPGADGV